MFHWICPECGREIAPTMRECPACDPTAAVAEPALVGVVEAPTPPFLGGAAVPVRRPLPTKARAGAAVGHGEAGPAARLGTGGPEGDRRETAGAFISGCETSAPAHAAPRLGARHGAAGQLLAAGGTAPAPGDSRAQRTQERI